MKTIILVIAVLLSSSTLAQKNIDLTKLNSLPKLELKDELQKFQVTTDHFNGDIFCNFFNKIRIKGEYTRGEETNIVKWNNVSVTVSMSREAKFPEGTPVAYMEDFSYKLTDDIENST